MFSLIRFLFLLAVCLVGIGLYRGWFSFSKPSQDAQSDKVNISVSIDAGKLKADAEKMKEKFAEKVGPKLRELEDRAKAQEAK
jgi:hypothetical protein